MENQIEKPGYFAVIPAAVRYDKDLQPGAKLLYGEITALATAQGFCWATNAYFAELYEVSIRTIQRWIEALVNKGYLYTEVTNIDGTDQRKIMLSSNCGFPVNENPSTTKMSGVHDKNVATPRQKCHGVHDKNVTSHIYNNTMNNTMNNNIRSSADDRAKKEPDIFDELWKLYPRKEGRKKAYASYLKAIRKGTTNEEIRNGIQKYVEFIERNNIETQYIKQGSTYFNGEHWTDELDMINRGDPFDVRNQYWDTNDPTVH